MYSHPTNSGGVVVEVTGKRFLLFFCNYFGCGVHARPRKKICRGLNVFFCIFDIGFGIYVKKQGRKNRGSVPHFGGIASYGEIKVRGGNRYLLFLLVRYNWNGSEKIGMPPKGPC